MTLQQTTLLWRHLAMRISLWNLYGLENNAEPTRLWPLMPFWGPFISSEPALKRSNSWYETLRPGLTPLSILDRVLYPFHAEELERLWNGSEAL